MMKQDYEWEIEFFNADGKWIGSVRGLKGLREKIDAFAKEYVQQRGNRERSFRPTHYKMATYTMKPIS